MIDLSLHIITNQTSLNELSHIQIAEQAIIGGAKVIQLREKAMPAKTLIKVAQEIRDLTKENRVIFIINDRIDIALAVEADGVHLGQDDMPIPLARKLLGNKIIGISTHSIEQALQAGQENVNYLSIGPIFATKTKDISYSLGLEIISQIKNKVKLPLIAIGGINQTNVDEVIKAGADGIAVISAISKAKDIASATSKLINSIALAKKSRTKTN